MKHFILFQGKLSNFIFLFIVGIILSVTGFSDNNNAITTFYYYQGKPMYLNLRTDKIFIKTRDVMTKDELKITLSQYTLLAPLIQMDVNEKMQFIDLAFKISASEIDALVKSLNQNPRIDYSSPVFSPFDGSGDKVLQGLTDDILVQFKPGVGENKISEYLNRNNFTIVQSLKLTGGISYVLKVPKSSGMYSIDAANKVYNDGLVNWSEPNFYFSGLLCYIPNDQYFPMQWSVRNLGNNIPGGITGTPGCDMRVDSAWNITLGIPQCVVGMVDSGIDTTHEDIRANLLISKGYDFYSNHPLQTDDMNHGTCTGGIVGAVGNNTIGVSGIAPNVKLIPVKIFNASGNTNSTAITNGLLYSWQQGEWISSNSWGGGSPISAATQAILDGTNLGRNGKGTVFCFATHNQNSSTIVWPSNLEYVISVGGNSPCNQRKSPSSCDNESVWGANYGTGLHIVAPCTKVYAPDRMGVVGYDPTNYFATFGGTSSATPNAAGVCALALSLDSNMRWDTLRARLDRTADKVGSYSYTGIGPLPGLGYTWNNEMGYGKVNAYKLLQLVQQMAGPAITHIPLGTTEQTTGTIAVNSIITSSGSPIDPSKTKLYYGKGTIFTDSLLMTNTGGNNWTQNITLSGSGTYKYYIKTADILNRVATAPACAPGNYYQFLSMPDTIRPVITHTPIANIPKAAWPVTVTANVTDNIGIDSVWVNWYKNNPSTPKRFKLFLVSGSTYTAAFNSLNNEVAVNDSIFYRIVAQDAGSNHKKDSTALIKFKIVVQTTACIGTGTTPISMYPFNTYWMGNRTHMLWTSAEILANQGVAGSITRIGFHIFANSGQTMNGFLIRMQHTTATSVTGFIQTGWTTVYSGSFAFSGPGWQYIDLQTPFQYNGTQNLLVDICYANTFYTLATSVLAGSMPGMSWYYIADLMTACTNDAGSTGTYRPNACFVFETMVGVNPNASTIPNAYSLSQNYPNPFNPVTRIKYDLPKQGFVTLKVYDVIGREVTKLVNEVKSPGSYIIDFDGTNLSSGVYFYKLTAGVFTDTKRMLMIK